MNRMSDKRKKEREKRRKATRKSVYTPFRFVSFLSSRPPGFFLLPVNFSRDLRTFARHVFENRYLSFSSLGPFFLKDKLR